jgi:arabinofuranosyltransferase
VLLVRWPEVTPQPGIAVANGPDVPSEAGGSRPLLTVVIGVTTAVAAVAGWRLFLFLTDDAYIAFRYVSNSMAGRGLVWNPAPFRPVEGYTSFLWVVFLRGVWSLTGIDPPHSANVILLLFGLATLFLGFLFVRRLTLPPRLEGWRTGFLALAMLGTVTNRTFLAWLSSGLETSLFNFLFTWWIFEGLAARGRGTAAWFLRLGLSAALCALCRPDGLLIVAGTCLILVLEAPRAGWSVAIGGLPLLAVPAHLLWRHATYGDWVPNTYRAKYEGPWPESGIRYLASFVFEYGVWWWLVLAAAWAVHRFRQGAERTEPWHRSFVRIIPILVVAAHLAYYTFIIGGDHFEYRVYSHLVLLLFISAVWFSARLARTGAGAAGLVAGFILVSYPIPWVHWWATKDVTEWKLGNPIVVPIADRFPWPASTVVGWWDGWQSWLIKGHMVGMRHQEHKVFLDRQVRVYPSREDGARIGWEGHHVRGDGAVGYPGWVLPNVAIIDRMGLADRVIARHAPRSKTAEARVMAHDRKPPDGYLECFEPDVYVDNRHAWLSARPAPLTNGAIRQCESIDWEDPRISAALSAGRSSPDD